MIKKIIIAGLIATASMQAYSQSRVISEGGHEKSNIQPGIYISEGGYGTLNVTKEKDGSTKFDIGAMGANGHTCGIDGTVLKNVAIVGDEPEMKCIVKFKTTPNGINVEPVSDECRGYCGMRASFDGEYFKVASSCLPANIDKSRKEFKTLYTQKKYSEALAKLEPVLNNCSQTLYWIETGWIRNDLAVTYAKLEKFDTCEKILAPLKDDSKLTKDELEYPPLEAETYWPVIKATKTNLKLCKVK